jgi:hypothetical protein
VNHLAAEDCSFATVLDAEKPYVEVRGVVRQGRMFGESLRLERTWRAEIGGRMLELFDRVINEGGEAMPHMLLYHCNAGYPLLDEHTEAFVSHRSMRARDAAAEAGIAEWNRGGPPQPGFHEQVFIHEPEAVHDGWAVAGFRNAALGGGMGFAVHYRPEQLPACFSWRMLGARTYVMAVEPANCPTIEGRVAAAKAGKLPLIAPVGSLEYQLRFEFMGGGTAAELTT